jgi:four helix bundle protein
MHYRDCFVWRKAMTLAEGSCRLADRLPPAERFGMRSQITRAAISVPSNISEGWTRESRKEKAHFLAIAQGSLAELHTQILLCQRLSWVEPFPADLLGLIDETSRMLTTLRRRMRQ